jgi:hypothetical protein
VSAVGHQHLASATGPARARGAVVCAQ